MKLLSLVLLIDLGTALPAAAAPAEPLSVSVSQRRVARGEHVQIVIAGSAGSPATGRIEAVLLQPRAGASSLALAAVPGRAGAYSATVRVGADAASGSYIVHAWSGERLTPAALGKGVFLVGPIVTDFAVPNYLDEADPAGDLDAYLADFVEIGGNFLVAHNLVTPAGAYYPSTVARIAARAVAPIDLVELVLERADRLGLGVLLSVGWDQTRTAPYSARFAETTALVDELYERYAHHPSMVGFYSWQEGSGTYYAGYVRAFGDYVKKRNASLLTACAPHMDDPLLAGYLSAVESLDVIIYQSGTMASYRPDNRKRYPIRRVKDFCSLGAGAALLQDKIALSHVELFGYLETRTSDEIVTTTPGNITRQILSAATVPGADGVSLFTYLAHVHAQRRRHPEVERSRAAVRDALDAFRQTSTAVSARRNALAVYVPYSDWVIERWTTSFLPALDGFRLLGVPVDVLPWAPRADESVLPYYPIHMNGRVLERLLAERTVLVMPDVSGLQQTDSDLIDAFVKGGGVLVLFGPQTPMGRTFDRRALIGADERPPAPRRAIVVEEAAGTRASAGTRLPLEGGRWPAWQAAGARVLARFDDGAAAVFEQRYGRGVVLAVALDVQSAARQARALTLDVLDRALRSAGAASLVVVDGTTIDTDVAVSRSNAGTRAAVVNHGVEPLEVIVRSDPRRAGLHLRVPPGEARVVELVPERKQ
jgi:hypothetical protein